MKKALLISTLLFACCAGGNNPNGNNQQTQSTLTESASVAEPVKETKTSKKDRVISSGAELTFTNADGVISFFFKEIKAKRLLNGSYNLVLTVQIKNNSGIDFWISDTEWMLTDANMIEVKESGVYDFEFGMFGMATFPMTEIKNGYGKLEEVGYQVSKGTYYLSILGEVQGKIEV